MFIMTYNLNFKLDPELIENKFFILKLVPTETVGTRGEIYIDM